MRANVSLLSEIAVYTYSEEVRLAEVFKAIATKENDGMAMSHKEDDAKLKAYFREILQNLMKTEYIHLTSKNLKLVQFVYNLKVSFL